MLQSLNKYGLFILSVKY